MGDIVSAYLNSLPQDAWEKSNEPLTTAPREAVDSPAHYGGKGNAYEAINVIEAYGMGREFCLGNCLKYLLRAGKKTASPLEDYKKAKWYLERLIDNEERKQNGKGSQTA